MPNKKNVSEVAALTESIANASGVVFIDYRGITANDVALLRREINKNSGVMKIAKNNLIKISLKDNGREIDENMLVEPTAMIFANGDMPAVAKVISESAKKNHAIKIKGGYIGEDLLSVESVEKVANIPSREALLSMLVTALESPISSFVTASQSIISDLPYTLEAVKDKKPA